MDGYIVKLLKLKDEFISEVSFSTFYSDHILSSFESGGEKLKSVIITSTCNFIY